MQARNQLHSTGYRFILCTLAQARPEGLAALKEGLTARMLGSDGTLRIMLQISSQSLPLRATKNAVSTSVPAALWNVSTGTSGSIIVLNEVRINFLSKLVPGGGF